MRQLPGVLGEADPVQPRRRPAVRRSARRQPLDGERQFDVARRRRQGSRASSWKTSARSADGPVERLAVLGDLAAERRAAGPARARSSVDLPQPDGPTTVRISPGATSRSTSVRATASGRPRSAPWRVRRVPRTETGRPLLLGGLAGAFAGAWARVSDEVLIRASSVSALVVGVVAAVAVVDRRARCAGATGFRRCTRCGAASGSAGARPAPPVDVSQFVAQARPARRRIPRPLSVAPRSPSRARA